MHEAQLYCMMKRRKPGSSFSSETHSLALSHWRKNRDTEVVHTLKLLTLLLTEVTLIGHSYRHTHTKAMWHTSSDCAAVAQPSTLCLRRLGHRAFDLHAVAPPGLRIYSSALFSCLFSPALPLPAFLIAPLPRPFLAPPRFNGTSDIPRRRCRTRRRCSSSARRRV